MQVVSKGARNRARLGLTGLWTGLLTSSLVLTGCASIWPLDSVRDEASATVERPDAPPEYDVLVAQQLEADGRMDEATAAYQRALAKDDTSPFLHRKLAEVLARSGHLDEARTHALRAFELDPNDVPTRMYLGQLHRLRRDPTAAAQVLLDDDGQPFDASAALLLYQIYLESSRLGDALETARWWVAQEPGSVRAGLALANAYQRLQRPLDAEQVLRDLLESDPGNLRLYGALARSLRERGDHEAEIQIYREVLEEHPDHHATLLALAQAQLSIDDLQGATQSFEEIERRYPGDLRSAARLGYLKYESHEFEAASVRFERVLDENPEEYEIAFFLGVVRRRSGDVEGAIESFDQVPEDHRYYAEARTQVASILERRGDFSAAVREVETAAALQPSRSLDLYAATLRAKAGDFEGAVSRLEGLMGDSPDDDELLYNLGVIHGEVKQTEEAIGYMERALELNPDNASALNYIGYTWAERGIHLDDAEEMINRAIELRPDDGYIVDSLGWVYYMRARPLVESGRVSEARGYIERALEELSRADELTGGDPVVSEHLGDTYLLLDEKQRALEKFEEALSLEPRRGEQPNLHEKLETLRRELH